MEIKKERLIEGYFERNLNPEQQREFEELMASDPEFSDAVNFQKKLKTAIKQEERHQLKAYLQKFDKPKNTYRLWWYAAACLAIGLSLTWWIKSAPSDLPQQLYTAYFEPYPNVIVPIVRGRDQMEKDLKTRAFSLYDQALYEEAVSAFEQLYKDSGQDYAVLYQAISLMASDHPKEAILLLEQKDWESINAYTEIAHWYLALAYLNNEEISKAKIYLQKVAETNHPLASSAVQLLQKLA